MGKPRRKRDKGRPRRPMKPGRLDAVRRIEGRHRPAAPPVIREAGASAAQASPAGPARPAASARVSGLRQLGLSVSVDATAEQLDRLEERFELACDYVRDVWRGLAGQAPAQAQVDDLEFRRFVARLLDDGRLADALVAAQKTRRLQGGPVPRGGDCRLVARALRQCFPACFPSPSLLGRLLGRG